MYKKKNIRSIIFNTRKMKKIYESYLTKIIFFTLPGTVFYYILHYDNTGRPGESERDFPVVK